jgi:hypothetical protein
MFIRQAKTGRNPLFPPAGLPLCKNDFIIRREILGDDRVSTKRSALIIVERLGPI